MDFTSNGIGQISSIHKKISEFYQSVKVQANENYKKNNKLNENDAFNNTFNESKKNAHKAILRAI